MKIYKEVSGQGTDIVTLHGWSCSLHHMQPIVDLLNPHYQVTNINLPGIAYSDWHPGTNSVHEVADQILGDLPENAIYIGWSFGGLVSMSIAARYPERVQRIIGVTTTPKFIADQDWPGVPQPGFKTAFAEVKKQGFDTFFNTFHDNEFSKINPKPENYYRLRQIVENLSPIVDLDILLAGIEICDSTDLRKEYQSLTCPIDLIFGTADDTISPVMHTLVQALNPNAKFHMLKDAGHMPFWTHPREFNRVLRDVLGLER